MLISYFAQIDETFARIPTVSLPTTVINALILLPPIRKLLYSL